MLPKRILISVLFVPTGTSTLLAQAPTAAVTGTVRDTAGDPISQTDVVARDVAVGYEYVSLTDEHGRYWLRSLPPGRYDLTASRIGVGSVVRRGVQLVVGQDVTIDFTLETRPVELPPLEVVDREPPIQTTRADISFVVDREQIIELPEESRGFLELAQLAPGATRAIDSGEPVGPTGVGALSSYHTGVLVDGVSILGAGGNELLGSLPLTAIEEFEVLTASYSAQYGQAASGIVNAVTRRGSNQLKIDGFMLYRHHTLNAQGVFEASRPDFNRRHWGLSAGGPIARDRTHMILAFERKVENRFATVETGGSFPHLDGSFNAPLEDNLLFGRVDHRFNASHGLTVRYAGQVRNARTDVGTSSLCSQIGGSANQGSQRYGADLDETLNSLLGVYRWSSRGGQSVNEARFSYQRRTENRVAVETGPSLKFPTICDGGQDFVWNNHSDRIEFRDDFSTALQSGGGSHRVRAGVLGSFVDFASRTGNFTNGVFSFPADTSSVPSQLILALQGIEAVKNSFQLALYVQDSWSPSPRLTLDFGLRYDIETNSTNQGFVAPEAANLPFVLASERPVDWNNLAPRLAFAWDPVGDTRTVVRGGMGTFYDQGALLRAGLESDRATFVIIGDPGTTDLDSIAVDHDAALSAPTFLGKRMETPFTRQFSLGVARVVPGQIVVSADGILVQGRNLPVYRQLNAIDVIDGVPGFRFPGFLLNQLVNEGRAEAQMLLVRVQRQADIGWFDVNYTLANRNVTTDVWFEYSPQADASSEDLSDELGPAAWDERHRVVVLAGVRAPWGSGLSLKSIYSSGRPYNVLTGSDDNGDFQINDRPAGVKRNSRRGPDFFTLDMGFYQRFRVGRGELEVRLNVYNLTNRSNFLPESVVGNRRSDSFGQPLAAATKRQVEIGVAARF